MRRLLACLVCLCALAHAGETENDPLRNLKAGHPRLLGDPTTFAAIHTRAKADPVYAGILRDVLAKAEKDLQAPVSKYLVADGKRLLPVSRAILYRTERLGMAWRLTKDRRFADRAWAELKAAAEFPDWNPKHFLDTAELCRAFAIGYDWLYDAWTSEQRTLLRTALVKHGLTPALTTYEGKGPGWFQKATNNWNQVCNAGVALGALAIADEEPKLARKIIRGALASLPVSTKLYAEDGSWDEGYGYFHYGAGYLVALIAGLESATGSDHGLGTIRGLPRMADYPCALEGPFGRYFNYADCGGVARAESMPEVGWLATRYPQPAAAALQRRHAAERPEPLDLLWLPTDKPSSRLPPRVSRFAANAVCTFRTAWNDPAAGFVGFKAGDNKASHGHLDIGSFVYDADGIRWAGDLGSDDYNLPSYFGKGRWDYYRLRAEGHNTLALANREGADQDPKAECQIITCRETSGGGLAIADLTAALTGLKQARRGLSLGADRALRIQDELTPGASATDLVWSLHTEADIKIAGDGRSATFTRTKERLKVNLLSPAGARLECVDERTLPPRLPRDGENPNKGRRKLIVRLHVDKPTTVVVDLVPGSAKSAQQPLKALSTW